jgi:hypothetical protein
VTFTPHPWQLASAEDYERLGGVFIGLDPGAGKSYALSRIAARCRRPLVVAPATAVPQTMRQFESYGVEAFEAKTWNGDWCGDLAAVAFASYTWLTGAKQEDFFERYRPTDILLDEFHMVRGLSNSARKRLERYLVANPAVRVAVSTASPMSGALTDFAFGLRWALRSGVAGLVPALRSGVEALDEKLQRDPAARAAFRARLEATPGVYLDVGDTGRYLGAVVLRVVEQAPALVLPDTWETPSGHLIESAAHAALVEKQLAWGWYYDTDPRPSEAYVSARRTWGGIVSRTIAQGLADTEFLVRPLHPEAYALWAEAQRAEGPLAEPVPHWADRSRVEWLSRYEADGPALVWAESRALQAEASDQLGCDLYREGGRAVRTGRYLPDCRDLVAVASIDACYQSLNLQHFSHNLVLEPPSDPEVWKQLLGRTARQGQRASRVTCDVVVNCRAAERALRTAVARAKVVYELTGKRNPLLTLEY